MVVPHTKNGHIKDNKKKIRLETNGESTTVKTEMEMFG
jgi:hypothetical protein